MWRNIRIIHKFLIIIGGRSAGMVLKEKWFLIILHVELKKLRNRFIIFAITDIFIDIILRRSLV